MRNGLLVVILPTVFQLAFLTALAILLEHTEREVDERLASKSRVAAATTVVGRTVDAELISLFYNVNPLDLLAMQFDESRRSAEEMSRQLIKLCSDKPDRLEAAKQIDASTRVSLKRLGRIFNEDFSQNLDIGNFVKTSAGMTRVFNLFTKSFLHVDTFLEMERKLQNRAARQEKQYRGLIKKIIIWSVSLNVLMTVVLAIFFTLGTTARLKTVLDNTTRLLNREPLSPPIGGDDEIAQLDTVFHATANDLASVDRHRRHLVSLVREDLSTPLRQVQFTLHNLSQGVLAELSDKAQSRLTMAAKDTDRVIRLIDDLLSIENMQGASFELKMSQVSSNDLIQQATSSVKQLADRAGINLAVQNSGVQVLADSDRIVQVLINFLSNAIKFSPADSIITIKTRQQEGTIIFSVTDKGRGIPGDKLQSVFERFQQVDSADQTTKGGTGLGLPISKSIIEQHGGSIGVDSQEGEGSTFWFALPETRESMK